MAAQPKLPCKFFLQNSCARGEACQYSHDRGPSTGFRRPTTVPPSTGSWRSATTAATPSTRSWRPATVPVSAGIGTSAAPVLEFRANVPGVVFTVPRAHGQQPSKSIGVQDSGEALFIPCKFFQKGFCSRGISCKFAHVLVGDSQVSERLPVGHEILTKETANTVNEVSLRLVSLNVHEWELV